MRIRRSLAALAATLLAAATAHADSNDFTLERIIGRPPVGGFNDPNDPIRQSMYRSLISELGVVMAPRFLSPSDTLGYNGFQIAFESSFTEISSDADFWKKGVENVSGGFLPTIGVFARKGIWLPIPSFELGAGVIKLIGANLFAVQAYGKLALHEGFHDWPIPSFAVRGSASRIVGANQADITIAQVDASLSKSIGLGGTAKLDPYLGAAVMFNIVKSQVIDTTPQCDAYRATDATTSCPAGGGMSLDLNSNTTFPNQDTIIRWRLFTGFRLVYAFLALTGEFVYTLCNDTGSDCGKMTPNKVTDRSSGQSQINFSGSLLF
jgi:hypothetical protein